MDLTRGGAENDERLRFLRFAPAAFPELRRHLKSIVQYELLFKILTFAIWSPLIAIIAGAIARIDVDTSLANEDVFAFFVTPVGATTLIVILSMAAMSLLGEQTGLMIIFAHGILDRRITFIRMLGRVVSKLPGLLAICFLRVTLYLAVGAPFAWLALAYYDRSLGGFDLNYLFVVRPPEFWRGLVVIGMISVAGLVSVLMVHIRLVFSLPSYLFEQTSVPQALIRSGRLARGCSVALARILVLWYFICILAGIGIDVMLEQFEALVVPRLGQDLPLIVTVFGLRFAAGLILETLIAVVAMVGNAYIVIRCFAVVGGEFRELAPERQLRFGPERISPWLLWTLPIAALAFSGFSAYRVVERMNIEDDVTIMAHRGSSMVAPENSISAILRAAEDGADYAEIDVQETSDGVVVLIHDTDLLRLTGLDRKIWDTSYDDLKELDAGGWFSDEFVGERIPTLDEAIESARGKIKLNIELKLNGHEDRLAERVIEIIRRNRFESDCMITSLSYPMLQEVRARAPDLEIGYVIFQALGRVSRFDVDQIMMREKLATSVALREAQRSGLGTNAWTVNNGATMHALIDRGIDGILTDYPDRLATVLQARSELNDVERLLLRMRELK